MARATFSQPSARPRSTPLLLSAVGLLTLFGLRLIFSGPAATLIRGVYSFLEYYAGVIILVSLSTTVIVGLVATDRMVMTIRQRILLQAAHRGAASASMAFLAIHIAMKILEGHASFVDVVVPFVASHSTVFIGFGTIAAYLMVVVAWTGVIRGRFARSAHPGIWRALHALAYVSWPFALVHGLNSGRPAATWVTVSYAACVGFVLLALLVRVGVTWGKRRNGPKATTSGTIRAVGKPVPRPDPLRHAPLPPPRREPPAPPPPPPRRAPTPPTPPPRRAPTPPRREPALPVGGRRHEESDLYGARGPYSRGRRARTTTRAVDAPPRPGVDMTDPGIPRSRVPQEPVTAPPATDWTELVDDSRTGYSQERPQLTFLDETPDEVPPGPRHAHPPAWDEPNPYHTGAHPAVGRHSGEYQMLQRTGGYRPTRQAALEAAPAYLDHDETDAGYRDRQPAAWADEPVSAPPAEPPRSRRRHRVAPEMTETPNDLPATRKPAMVLTDEEFWAHMRGDAVR